MNLLDLRLLTNTSAKVHLPGACEMITLCICGQKVAGLGNRDMTLLPLFILMRTITTQLYDRRRRRSIDMCIFEKSMLLFLHRHAITERVWQRCNSHTRPWDVWEDYYS